MPSKTISVTNGDGSTRTITIPDRSRFAGVKTFSRNGKLDDSTTSIQVTVSGHSDLDGVYTGSGADVMWTQQGGNGRIATYGYNSENGDQMWFIYDDNDYDPNGFSGGLFSWSPTHVSQFPWLDLPSSHNVTITPVPETVTVNRTAPVITSDRKGESRPLLSKLVGGAEAAYSLRDLNDKAGNNKVVEVRRSSDNEDRKFLAKEVSNGTLEAWVGAGNDGFVSKWYDQSGNGFDMVQAESTKQPKIVEAGNFLGSVKYDGTAHYLKSATVLNFANQSLSLFSVQTNAPSINASTLGKHNSGRGLGFTANAIRVFITSSSSTINHPTVSNNSDGFNLGTLIHTGDGSSNQIRGFRNGEEKIDTAVGSGDTAADGQPITTTTYNILGGNRSETGSTTFFSGEIKEVVVYKANQLTNRPAIEANLANQYDITLS